MAGRDDAEPFFVLSLDPPPGTNMIQSLPCLGDYS
jgi:hypothetical protein